LKDTTKNSSHTLLNTQILLPWIVSGWYAFTRENRRLALGFIVCAAVVIASWAILFYSRVYRWTFSFWPFFAAMTLAAFMSIISAGVLAAVCWKRFDRGLKQYCTFYSLCDFTFS
jgi:hypothetical protein